MCQISNTRSLYSKTLKNIFEIFTIVMAEIKEIFFKIYYKT